jgi:phosphohistidine phosphatase SixA
MTTIILIRHAERDDLGEDPNPSLNEAGKKRAQKLLHVLGSAGIKAIYTSHYIRTKETAEPLATRLNLVATVIDEPSKIKNDIMAKHKGETVLVVGHTDTVPELINLLGGIITHIKDNEFDNLFVATLFEQVGILITQLKYGEPN